MNHIKKIYLIILILVFVPKQTFGQNTLDESLLYTWFDNKIGEINSGIYNGLEYVEHYRMLNEKHKFFLNPNFSNGMVIYKGEPYYNLLLKYDLFEDQLLLRYLDKANTPIILLDKDYITHFSIENHQFEKLQFETKKGKEFDGFFELLLLEKSIKLYKKNHKKILTKSNERIKYYEFKEQNSYVVFYKNKYFQINSLNNLSSIFSEHKVILKQIEDKYKSIKKSNSDAYLKSVLQDLSNEI
ncbi:MAG: hypothetical protein K9I95_13240 [Flavobacteriaceae bacterium]|nr:hypothetical protein [Flavobacteriaceae bacterium]